MVRIADFDAPEKGSLGYQAATDRLSGLIKGIRVGLEGKAIDPYGRLIADVYVGGNGGNVLLKNFL